MKWVFVTGGSGFVGRNLIMALVERGAEVHALARSDAAAEAVQLAGAHPVRGDLDAVEVMAEAMRDCDVVFHAAAKVDLWGDAEKFHHVNVEGTRNVIEAAKWAGVPKLVHVSTEALLAGGKPLVDADETWPYPEKPVGPYAVTKGLAERQVIEANGPELQTVAVRPPLIWGAGDTSVLPKIAAAVKQGRWMWFDGGHYPHTTTNIANVIEGLLLAAEKGRGGEVYFISDGEAQEFRAFITELLKTRGVDGGAKSIPFWLAQIIAIVTDWLWQALRLQGPPPLPRAVLIVMGQKLTVNDAKARAELGYQGRVTFEEGLKAMRHG